MDVGMKVMDMLPMDCALIYAGKLADGAHYVQIQYGDRRYGSRGNTPEEIAAGLKRAWNG